MARFDPNRRGILQYDIKCEFDNCDKIIPSTVTGICDSCSDAHHLDQPINGIRYSYCFAQGRYQPLALKMPRAAAGNIHEDCNYCRNVSPLIPPLKYLIGQGLGRLPTAERMKWYLPVEAEELFPGGPVDIEQAVWSSRNRRSGHVVRPEAEVQVPGNGAVTGLIGLIAWGVRNHRSPPRLDHHVHVQPAAAGVQPEPGPVDIEQAVWSSRNRRSGHVVRPEAEVQVPGNGAVTGLNGLIAWGVRNHRSPPHLGHRVHVQPAAAGVQPEPAAAEVVQPEPAAAEVVQPPHAPANGQVFDDQQLPHRKRLIYRE